MSASKIAVIETRLPYTDRRALSEAWFSALHLAHDAGSLTSVAKDVRATCGRDPQARAMRFSRHVEPIVQRRASDRASGGASRLRRGETEVPMRRLSDARPGSVERLAFERARSYAPFRTSLTLDGANGTRVHLIVRRVGPTLHIVALCPPAAEALVRRAFARADLHFRARGERISVDIAHAAVRA